MKIMVNGRSVYFLILLVFFSYSKLFSYSCSRSQKTQLKELLGHYWADSVGPLLFVCVLVETAQAAINKTQSIIGVAILDCQMSVWGQVI
jgi:hypothetical protein